MFRDVPECCGMFHVPGFIDTHFGMDLCNPFTKTVQIHLQIAILFAIKKLRRFHPEVPCKGKVVPCMFLSVEEFCLDPCKRGLSQYFRPSNSDSLTGDSRFGQSTHGLTS